MDREERLEYGRQYRRRPGARAVQRAREAEWLNNPENRDRKNELARMSAKSPHRRLKKKKYTDARNATLEAKVKARDRDLRRAYGVSYEDVCRMYSEQEGRCKICEIVMTSVDPSIKRSLLTPHVDHDHESGKVRGLLCGQCNVGLGNFKEDATVLSKAITYLNSHAKDSST